MAKIRFKNNKVEDYTIVLSTRDKRHLGQLHGLKSVRHAENMNSANEMSFSIYKDGLLDFNTEGKTDDKIKQIKESREKLWKSITNHKLIWVKELEEYFEITVNLDDSTDVVKNITATSLCEAELSQTNLYSIEINSDEDIEFRGGGTVFYNPSNPKLSLLHRILDKTPNYTIKYVESSLWNIQRTFSIDGTSIYDFMIGDCSTEIGCLFQFDSITRGIYVYDLFATCLDCGERGDFDNECTKCHSENLNRYGNDTTIFIDKNNLTDSIHYEESPDTMKNCFKLEAGDDTITAAVMQLNPNGSDSIMSFSSEQMNEMPEELSNKIKSYNDLYQSKTEEYEDLTRQYYDLLGEKNEYEYTMMPTVEQAEINASTEVAKLTTANLSPTSMSIVSKDTTVASVNLAILTYAKVYVRTGYVKLEINDGATFKYVGSYTGADGSTYYKGTWTGSFKVTNYSDEEDVKETGNMTIEINNDFVSFNEQKFKKSLVSSDEDTVFDVLNIKDLNKFKEALNYYSLSRLESFYNAIDGALLVLKQSGQGEEGADLYEELYVPYDKKLKACETEHQERSKQIETVKKQLDNVLARQKEINKELDFKTYLGEELYSIFCSYRREDKYSNSNYVSDGLDDSGIIDKAKEFLKVAKMELEKATKKQITITSTLYNLLLMPEFKPLIEHFELGNWLRIKVDGKIYTLRLIGYEIDFDNIQTINVTFSNASEENDFMSDVESILSSAQNLTSSFDSVTRQAEQGSNAQSNIQQWINEGLDSALVNINNSHATFTFTEKGLLGRTYDDVLGVYGDEQLIITDNVIGFTSNNWASLECALGKHNFRKYDSSWDTKTSQTSFRPYVGYGLTSKFVQSAHISGSEIIGGKIYSENYSSAKGAGTIIDLNEGTFNFGGTLKYDGQKLTISNGSDTNFTEITENCISTTNVVAQNLKVKSANIDGKLVANQIDATDLKVAAANITGQLVANQIDATNLKVAAANVTGQLTANQINATNLQIAAGNVTGKLTASQIDATNLKVAAANITGTLTASQINTTGLIAENISATTLSGKNISGGSLLIGNTSGTYAQITSAGVLNCNGANVTGTINASSGKIGNWTFEKSSGGGDSYIYASNTIDGSTKYTVIKSGGSVAIGLGSPAYNDTTGANIQLCHNGKAIFKDVEVRGGSITSSGVKIDNKTFSGYVGDIAADTITATRINSTFLNNSATLQSYTIHGKDIGLYSTHSSTSGFTNNTISLIGSTGAITCNKLTCDTLVVYNRTASWVTTTINGKEYKVLATTG